MSASTARALLDEVKRHGGRLVLLADDRLRAEAPEPLPDALLATLREHKAEILRLLRANREAAEKNNAVLFTSYGAGYVHPDGRIETGQPDPMPRPAMGWPADLGRLLSRVSCAFEWQQADVRDFMAWARRSPEALADARQLLAHEAAKLPAPGLSERRRAAVDMLVADPALRVAWTCADDGSDPVVVALAIRDRGTCELAIPRAKFDALALPGLIAELAGIPCG